MSWNSSISRSRRLGERSAIKLAQILIIVIVLLYSGNFEVFQTPHTHIHTADDHMITMRVAYNYLEYGVPYFNKNEPVSANTSLFWPLVLGSTIMHLGPVAAVVTNILISTAISVFIIIVATSILKSYSQRATATVLILGSATFFDYAVTGWEHIPQCLFFTLGLISIYNSSEIKFHIPNKAMALVCISFLFRPDSAMVILLSGIVWFFHCQNYKKNSTYIWSFIFLTLPTAYIIMMEHYYGSMLPNTVALKNLSLFQSLTAGLEYVFDPSKSGIVPVLLALILLLRPKQPFSQFLLVLGAGHLVYVIYVGGDVFGNGRFFILLMPTVVAVFFNELYMKGFWPSSDNAKRVICSLVIVLSLASNYKDITKDLFPTKMTPVQEQVNLLNIAQEKISPKDGSIGLHYLGLGYHFPNFHIVDFLGKAEPHIARTSVKFGPIGHNRWDYDYALEKYNIVIIPIQDSVIEEVSKTDFILEKEDWMFLKVGAQAALGSGMYEYIPADHFGNNTFGALVRTDQIDRFHK